MKKYFTLKIFFVLFALLTGIGSASAQEDYDYDWVKVNPSDVATGDVVVIADASLDLALPNSDNTFKGVSVTIGDNKIKSNVTSGIQWVVTKNDNETLTFKREDLNNGTLWANKTGFNVGSGSTKEFTITSDPYLKCTISSTNYYLYWQNGFDYGIIKEGTSGSPDYIGHIALYKKTRANYTKWKEVSFANLKSDDIVVIVDKATGKAMTNDKGDSKKPGTADVQLNADKDRITGSVAGTIQWKGDKENSNIRFKTGDNYLRYDASSLSVGETTDKHINFTSVANNCLKTEAIDSKYYHVGLKSSMMSTSWEIKEEGEGGAVNDDIKNTQIAFYVKEVSPQKIVKLTFASDEFYADINSITTITPALTCKGTSASNVVWTSSNTAVATVDNNGVVTLKKRGTTVITARVAANDYHDKASATCTIKVDDTSQLGSVNMPLTVAQAKTLAQDHTITVGDETLIWEEGTCYYIQGVISKVSGGIFDMFGDMEIPGMDDMDFDLDALGDFSLPGMGGDNGTCSYYISDDGTKDNQMKVTNGHGEMITTTDGNLTYSELKSSAISPGDKVIVYGPLVYTEDKSMMAGMGGSGSGDSQPKYSAKVDEVNGMYRFHQVLYAINPGQMYENTQKDVREMWNVNTEDIVTVATYSATFKSSDEEVAKIEDTEAYESKKALSALKVGTSTITVKVKVTLTADDPNTSDVNEEKAYTMKRKFDLEVITRDKKPNGYKYGRYEHIKNSADLQDGDMILIVGDDNDTPYTMSSNDAMMGGKEGVATEYLHVVKKDDIVQVPEAAFEAILEKVKIDNDDTQYYRFRNSNGDYLYASDPESGSGMDISSLFGGGGAKLKFGTIAEQGDSLLATMELGGGANIRFKFADRVKHEEGKDDVTIKAKNCIKFGTKLDFDMSLFGGGGDSGSDMSGIFDSFKMPAFSAYDADDTKHVLPSIYRFVEYDAYPLTVGEAKWSTLVSAYDVTLPENYFAYVVTAVEEGKAVLSKVTTSLKAGEPYLINAPELQGTYELTKTTDAPAPAVNLLKVSDHSITGDALTSTVYVLANKTAGVGFYKWIGGLLGAGRVYLPIPAAAAKGIEFVPFMDVVTEIHSIDQGTVKNSNAPMYNLAGQRVGKNYKGVVIVNGKKVVIK